MKIKVEVKSWTGEDTLERAAVGIESYLNAGRKLIGFSHTPGWGEDPDVTSAVFSYTQAPAHNPIPPGENVRIVLTDNFGRSGESQGHDETFFLGPMPPSDGRAIVNILNKQGSDQSPIWYKLVSLNYKLQRFEP